MEPAIYKNNFILIKGSNSYKKGDIVTYISESGSLITHRIIALTDTGYITQGDANNTADREIKDQRFLGKVIFIHPTIGIILRVFSSPIGIAFILAFPIGIYAILTLGRRMKE